MQKYDEFLNEMGATNYNDFYNNIIKVLDEMTYELYRLPEFIKFIKQETFGNLSKEAKLRSKNSNYKAKDLDEIIDNFYQKVDNILIKQAKKIHSSDEYEYCTEPFINWITDCIADDEFPDVKQASKTIYDLADDFAEKAWEDYNQ